VFQAVKRIVEKSPLLRREAKITQNRIEFPETGATITAIGSDYAGSAGANPSVSAFDELWAFTSERSVRPPFPTLPIIAMTASVLVSDREMCREAGMNDHIAKPIDPNHLLDVLLRWIPRGGDIIKTASNDELTRPDTLFDRGN
jgi:hypothetical protein